ncbi:MAG: CxxxxCH/CxxCH domain c-type cytochrome, partial [Myxococcaceae bacterium]
MRRPGGTPTLAFLVLTGAVAAGCSCERPPAITSEDAGWEEPLVDGGEEPDAGLPLADAGPLTCTSCHGTAEVNSAPPFDVLGRSDRALRGIGAHQAHLLHSDWHRDGECADCHVVPAEVDAPGHLDAPPAELTWGAVPRAAGAAPAFDGKTCASVYCHGTTLSGGALTVPDWTRSDIAQAYCGDCHGVPPPPPHPRMRDSNCGHCHPNARNGMAFAEPQRHIDGVLDLRVGCTDCHGDPRDGGVNDPAPPRDTAGNTTTSTAGVGAHQSHLGASSWHAEVVCSDCHVVPGDWSDPGHLDGTPALTWGAKANARGASPAFDGLTCSGVYCHGATIDGGSNQRPAWTTVNGTQAACGTCHSLPPGGPHPQNTSCALCHPAVIAADGGWVDPDLHINGIVEATGGCGACHALPPTTGSHQKHAGLG